MILTLHIVTIFLSALAMCMSLAHALEFPGTMRLNAQTYLAVQTIYYPGFTIGGISEPVAILASLLLLVAMRHSRGFAWTAVAFAALICMHAIFWVVTQPANRFWLRNQQMAKASSTFFGTEKRGSQNVGDKISPEWTAMRSRWEHSHIVRACLSSFALIALVIALAQSLS